MLSRQEFSDAQKKALPFFKKAGIVLTEREKAGIEVADLGLGDLTHTGLEIVTYVNTQRCCAKELILFPRQTCPEHRHPAVAGEPGKEETFRCRWGTVYLYVPGAKTSPAHGVPPSGRERYYTVWHEVILRPGEQYTLSPDTLHWFQSGDEGAVVSEFSTRSRDESDIFTDPHIGRATQVKD
jgi:D-lyxose ketol-isomerase